MLLESDLRRAPQQEAATPARSIVYLLRGSEGWAQSKQDRFRGGGNLEAFHTGAKNALWDR